MRPSIQVEGARDLRRQLRAIQGGIDGMKDLHRGVGELVGERAAELVPVRSGRLKSTIRAAGQAAGAVVRAGYAVVPYAGPIHFGWAKRNIKPQPFLYDALDDRRAEVMAMYDEQIAELIKKNRLD